MSTEPDNRLIDDPEFSQLIEVAQTIDVEDAWLDSQFDQILEKIDSPTPPSGGSTGSGGGAGNIALSAVKLFAPLIVGLGVYVAFTSNPTETLTTLNRIQDDREQTRIVQNEASSQPPTSSNAGEEPPNMGEITQGSTQQGISETVNEGTQRTSKVSTGPGRAEAAPERNESDMPTPETVHRHRTQQSAKVPPGQIRDILKIIKTARSDADAGDIDKALELLRPLLSTSFRPEILRVQADLAYQHERYAIAVESIKAILVEPNLDTTSKRSFLRRLGDALAKEGACGQALLTYQKALKLSPEPEESAEIRAAIVRCQ